MFPNQFDEAEKIINAPFSPHLDMEIEARLVECKHRLLDVSLHDPVVNASLQAYRHLRREFVLTDEDCYAMMAFELLRAKLSLEKVIREYANRYLTPLILSKETTDGR